MCLRQSAMCLLMLYLDYERNPLNATNILKRFFIFFFIKKKKTHF